VQRISSEQLSRFQYPPKTAFIPLHQHAVLEDWCFDAARFRTGCEVGDIADWEDGDETEKLCGSCERLYDACAAESVEYCRMCQYIVAIYSHRREVELEEGAMRFCTKLSCSTYLDL